MYANTFIIPPGKYFLGDPYYAVPYAVWDSLLESCDYFGDPIGNVEYQGENFKVYAFRTMYGDGEYRGSDGKRYSVDAGLIGLTPIDLCKNYTETFMLKLGSFIEFEEPTECIAYTNGKLSFAKVTIDTGDADMDMYQFYD